jgi:hypothetical protein
MTGKNKRPRERRHHYLPQFYLAGFTDKGTKKGHLWVLDHETRGQWIAKPDDVAIECDLYRLDPAREAPLTVERVLETIESKAAPVIRNIARNHEMPDGEDYLALMEFIAAMVVRVPRLRNQDYRAISEFVERGKKMSEWTKGHPWKIVSSPPSPGSQEGPSLKDLAAVTESKDEFTHQLHVPSMFTVIPGLVPFLAARHWTIWLAPSADADFICSDSPIFLQWITPVPPFYSPGFGLGNTYLTFPLSRRVALAAAFEIPGGTLHATREQVAAFNSSTAASSERFLFSRHKDFLFQKRDGSVSTTTEEALDEIEAQRRNRRANNGKN